MRGLGIGVSAAMRASGQSGEGFDFTQGRLPPGASLSRASVATARNAAGRIVEFGIDQPRFEHDAASGELRGLLIEAAATNFVRGSDRIGDTGWTIGSLVVDDHVAGGIDGGQSASRLEDADTGRFGFISQAISATGPAVASLYVRKDAIPSTTRFAMLRLAPDNDLRIDTMTGGFHSPSATGGVIDSGDWWRFWVRASAAPGEIEFYPAVGAGQLQWGYGTGATGSVEIAGIQVEPGIHPTSQIRTGATAQARAADVLTLNWGAQGVRDGVRSLVFELAGNTSVTTEVEIVGGRATMPIPPGGQPIRQIILA